MLLSAKRLIGRNVLGADASIGALVDVFFTESSGNVRYLVIKTGAWLESREILLAPHCIERARPDVYELFTKLSRHLVEHSPPITADLPISRAFEERLHGHYGWARYWSAASTAEAKGVTVVLDQDEAAVDSTLRSVKDVLGHRLHAIDGEIGHLDDLLIDPFAWDIVYAVGKTRNWLPGKSVLVPWPVVRQVRWDTNEIMLAWSCEQVRAAPSYDDRILTDEPSLSRVRAKLQSSLNLGQVNE